jgi:universal stress protein E
MKHPILLIAAGPGKHTPALQRAFDLARSAELPVHVGVFVHDPLVDAGDPFVDQDICALARRELLAEHQAWVDALTARWRRDGLDATGAAVWAPVTHEAILELVAQLEPALIVKDVGHEPLLRRITYTALDWKLLRQAPAPLMLVDGRSSHLPEKILAAVDTMPATPDATALNALILREALKLAGWAEAEVHLAHVFPYLTAYAGGAYRALERVYAETRGADRDAFAAFATEHQVPPELRHWLEGNPVQRLADLVREHGVDLLVLGSSHHSALDRLLLGSTAENMLYQVPCDVLLVKPEPYAAALLQKRRAA